jgi:hypothetical protein
MVEVRAGRVVDGVEAGGEFGLVSEWQDDLSIEPGGWVKTPEGVPPGRGGDSVRGGRGGGGEGWSENGIADAKKEERSPGCGKAKPQNRGQSSCQDNIFHKAKCRDGQRCASGCAESKERPALAACIAEDKSGTWGAAKILILD